MIAYLLMNTGVNSGARFELNPQEENLMGRDWQCQIALNDPQCSRIHAVIFRNDEGWWISDKGSSNGTFVNGQGIDSARLMDGTQVRIGSNHFTFNTSSPVKTTEAVPEEEAPTSTTIVFDRSHDTNELGQYTLSFLKGSNIGQDFFFLFQLSVKLLSANNPDEVVSICMERLLDRTGANIAGFLWLSESGQLKPKWVYPEGEAEKLQLRKDLTKRVVLEKHAIRVEYEGHGKNDQYADAICVPLISSSVLDENEKPVVQGAIHLYRQSQRFDDSHVELASALANIMVRALRQANSKASLAAEHSSLMLKTGTFDELVGESSEMTELKSKITRVAKASGCVLIRGESGAGKELVARAIHRNSPRADRPMLTVNCAAIPRELMESQLFGHKQGAFTSADRDHVGWFQQADLGTLFLDEIGELTLEGQAKLLRILEGHPFMPVGSTEQITVDVRVICATNRDLREFVNDKRFREDLYYRLSVYELYIPPLRNRGGDIQLLIDRFLKHFRERHGKFDLELSPDANRLLLSYTWPGNVRQLRNVIDSAVVMADGNEIAVHDIGIRDPGSQGGELETLQIAHWEKKLIIEALKRTGNAVPEAAKLLGISRATLYRKIDEYNIARGE
ncbi:MAG: sigma 54-interacting transcriptional regulator [Pirellulaceae bacterium]